MDLKVNNLSFSGVRGNAKYINSKVAILTGALMGLSLAVSAQNNLQTNDTFTKTANYITLTVENDTIKKKEILEPLKRANFFPEKDNEIITSILSSIGVESLWYIPNGQSIEAFGEAGNDLYKFYVRKSKDNLYYGLIDKFSGTGDPETEDCCANENKSFAFILRDLPNDNSVAKMVKLADLDQQDYKYCHNFMFGDGNYNKADDIKVFTDKLLSTNIKELIFTTNNGN